MIMILRDTHVHETVLTGIIMWAMKFVFQRNNNWKTNEYDLEKRNLGFKSEVTKIPNVGNLIL